MKSEELNILQIVGFLIFSILIFLLGSVNFFKPFQNLIVDEFEDEYAALKDRVNSLEKFGKIFNNINKTKQENDDLRDEITSLESEVTKLTLQLENVSFVLDEGISDFDNEYTLIPVRVLYYEDNQSGLVYINKGDSQGISENDIVVLGQILIGDVIKTHENYSEVKLIATSNYKINVVTLEKETRGILEGTLGGDKEVKQILTDADLEVGDIFVSEGNDGVYPYGFFVGRVDRIIGNPAEPVKTAVLTTGLNFKDLSNLYIAKIR